MTPATMPHDPVHKSPVGDTINAKGDTITKMYMTEPKMPTGSKSPMGGHGSTNLADAQAIKDATMSHFLMKYWQPGKLFIHYNGAYHSDEFESMNWFLKQAKEDLRIVTISTVNQDEIEMLDEESLGKADFIIAVPSTMTKTMR